MSMLFKSEVSLVCEVHLRVGGDHVHCDGCACFAA